MLNTNWNNNSGNPSTGTNGDATDLCQVSNPVIPGASLLSGGTGGGGGGFTSAVPR